MPPQPGLVNLANALTVIRLVLVPVVVACLLAAALRPGLRRSLAWRLSSAFAALRHSAPLRASPARDVLDSEGTPPAEVLAVP